MNTNENKRAIAQILIVHQKMSQKEVSAKIGISEQTLSKWGKEDNWDELKKSLLTSRQDSLRRLYAHLQELTNKEKLDSKDIDGIGKLSAAIRNLETEVSIGDVIDVFMQFNEFLKQTAPKTVLEYSDYQDAFIKKLLNS